MSQSKRSGSEKRQRPLSLTVRFNDAEHAEVVRRADAVGLTPASYMRLAVIDVAPPRAARTPPIDRQLVAQVLAQIGKVGSNVNQIAYALNAGRPMSSVEVERAMAAVLDMRDACLKALGRQP